MRWLSSLGLLALCTLTAAERIIVSNSLRSCAKTPAEKAAFSASRFHLVFTPGNVSALIDIDATSLISGNVTAEFTITAYGYKAYSGGSDGCSIGLEGLCPLTSGNIPIKTQIPNLSPDVVNKIPGIAYTLPDIDGEVTARILRTETGEELTCLQASLTNGKTVYHKGVGWATAVIAGSALLVSAIVSGLGHNAAAVHVAANALSLFGFLQHQAIMGMTAVHIPPIVAAWTQNFQWSLGIIKVGFVQDIATWYQRATGGTPSVLLDSRVTPIVDIQKRHIGAASGRIANYMSSHVLPARAASSGSLMARQSSNGNAVAWDTTVARGIERVAYNAGIEPTNIFMTGYIFFVVFVMLVFIVLIAFKGTLDLSRRSGKVKPLHGKFQDFRKGWTIILKGILFRLILIAFAQVVILGFWELVVARDSPGEMTLAAITVVTFLVSLVWACWKVVTLAKQSIRMHANPAYALYSDPAVLHKWGFLYVQYKATCYWFIIPWLIFVLLIGLFTAVAQSKTGGIVQAIAFLILEASYLIAAAVIRPWMDKKTNFLNIAIASVNFSSSIWLLFFSGIFDLPPLAIGVMGILFFVVNAIFTVVLLISVLVSMGYAVFSKNPDVRYQPMRDDRASFIISQDHLPDELNALGATARGEEKVGRPARLDDNESTGFVNVGRRPISTRHDSYKAESFDIDRSAQTRSYSMTVGQRDDNIQYRGAHATSAWHRGAGYE